MDRNPFGRERDVTQARFEPASKCMVSRYLLHQHGRAFWGLLRYRETFRKWVGLKCPRGSLSVKVSASGTLRVIYWSKVLLPDSTLVSPALRLLTRLPLCCTLLCCSVPFPPPLLVLSFSSWLSSIRPSSNLFFKSLLFPTPTLLLLCQSLKLCHSVSLSADLIWWRDGVFWSPSGLSGFGSGVCALRVCGLDPLDGVSRLALPQADKPD